MAKKKRNSKKNKGTGLESANFQMVGKMLFVVGFIMVICSASSLMFPQFLLINNALFIGIGLVLISLYMTIFVQHK